MYFITGDKHGDFRRIYHDGAKQQRIPKSMHHDGAFWFA